MVHEIVSTCALTRGKLSKIKNGENESSLPPNYVGVNEVSFTQVSV